MPRFLANVNLVQNELQNARVQNLASAPGSPVAGQIYYNSADGNLYVYDGVATGWVDLTVQGGTITYAAPSQTINAGDTASAGVATTVIRSDAQFAVATAAASTLSGSNTEGSSTNLARADHNHAIGSNIIPVAAFTTGVTLNAIATANAATASITASSQKITNLADGTATTDAATWGQVQTAQQGIDAKASVRAATTAAGTLATSFENTDVIDGVTLATNDRILIKNQASAQENGIYTVNASGAPTRATDMDAWGEVPNAYVWVEEGTANADTAWVSTANAGGTLNTTAIPWALFSSAGSLIAGAGLTKTGDTLDFVSADTSLTVNADSAQVRLQTNGGLQISTGVGIVLNGSTLNLSASGLKVTDNTFQPLASQLTTLAAYNTNGTLHPDGSGDLHGRTLTGTSNRLSVTNGNGVSGNPTFDIDSAYVGQSTITTLGTITTGTWTGTAIAVANGGTGATSASGARTNLGVPGKYTTATHASGTTISVTQATHGLTADRSLTVTVNEVSSGDIVYPDKNVASNGDVVVTFASSVGANTYRVTIIG